MGRLSGRAVWAAWPGMVKRVRGVAHCTRVAPAAASRMVDGARGVLNALLADVYVFTDAMSGAEGGASPGFGLALAAETTAGLLLGAQAASPPPVRAPDSTFMELSQVSGCEEPRCLCPLTQRVAPRMARCPGLPLAGGLAAATGRPSPAFVFVPASVPFDALMGDHVDSISSRALITEQGQLVLVTIWDLHASPLGSTCTSGFTALAASF